MIKKITLIISAVFLFSCAAVEKRTIRFQEASKVAVRIDPIINCYFDDQDGMVYYTVYEGNNYNIYKKDTADGSEDPLASTSYDEILSSVSGGMVIYQTNQDDVRSNIRYEGNGRKGSVGNTFVEEISPVLRWPDLAYLTREDDMTLLKIEGIDDRRSEEFEIMGGKEICWGTDGGIYIIGDKNNLYKFDDGTPRMIPSQKSEKHSLRSDGTRPGVYYISYPVDTDGNGTADLQDHPFVIYNDGDKEEIIFYKTGMTTFDIKGEMILYTDGKTVSMVPVDDMRKGFSTIYHYIALLDKSDDPGEVILLSEEIAGSERPEKEKYLFASSCINQLLEKESRALSDMIKKKFMDNLEADSPFRSMLSKYNSDPALVGLMEGGEDENLMWNRLYLARDDLESYQRLYSRYYKRLRNRRIKNSADYLLAVLRLENRDETGAYDILVRMLNSTLTPGDTEYKALDLLLKNKGRYTERAGYSINIMEGYIRDIRQCEFLRAGAAAAVMETLALFDDAQGAVDEGEKIFSEIRETEPRNLIYEKMLEIYRNEETMDGVEYFAHIIQEGYNGRLYYEMVDYVREKGLLKAEKNIESGDMLQARKSLLTVRSVISGDLTVNREIIKLEYSLGNIIKTAGQYKSRYLSMEKDADSIYLYGYALSYAGTYYGLKGKKEQEAAAYRRSLELIRNAMSLSPQEPYFYLTAGWLEERLEQLGEGKFLEMALVDYKTGLGLSYSNIIKGYFKKNMANVYFKLKLYNQALDSFLSSSRLVSQYGNKNEQLDYFLKMSQIYYNLEDYDKAIEYDHGLYALYSEKGDKGGMDFIHRHRGLLYSLKTEYLKAVKEFESGLRISGEKISRDDEIIYLRNIAYNALMGEDEEKAIQSAQKLINIIGESEDGKSSGGLLNINVDVSIGGKGDSSAYLGFSHDMEKELAYTILARAHEKTGDYDRASYYYEIKLKRSRNKFGDMVIFNNLANLYFKSGMETFAVKYLDKSLDMALKEGFERGYIMNRLSAVFLKREAGKETMDELDEMVEDVEALGGGRLKDLYKMIYIYMVHRSSEEAKQGLDFHEAMAAVENNMRQMERARIYLQELSRDHSSPLMQRLRLLYLYDSDGREIKEDLLALTGEDKFADFIIFSDLAYLDSRSHEKSVGYLSDSLSSAESLTSENIHKIYYYHMNRPDYYPGIVQSVAENVSKDKVIDLLARYDALFERALFIIFKPDLSSQFDTVNINNYFYYTDKGKRKLSEYYLDKLDPEARNLTGLMSVTLDDVKKCLTGGRVLYYRMKDKYLRITSDGCSVASEVEGRAPYIVDRKGDDHVGGSYFFSTLQQFILFFNNRFMMSPVEEGDQESIFTYNSGTYSFQIEGEEQINPYKTVFWEGLDMGEILAKGLTIDGIKLESAAPLGSTTKRLMGDVMLYNGTGYLDINGCLSSYGEMSSGETGDYIEAWKTVLSKNAYIYMKEGLYQRAFRELKRLISLLKVSNDKQALADYTYRLIKIASDNMHDPSLIEDELKLYLSLRGNSSEPVYYDRLSRLYEKNGYYTKALEYMERTGGTDPMREAQLYEKLGDFQSALKLYDAVDTEEALLGKAVIHYKYFKEYRSAEQTLEDITKPGLEEMKRLTYALIKSDMGSNDEAIKMFNELEGSSDKKIRVNSALGRATAYYRKYLYIKTAVEAENIAEEAKRSGLIDEYLGALNLKALALIESGAYDTSLAVFEEAIKLAEQYNIINQITVLKINKAKVLRKQGDFPEALDILKALRDEYEEKENRYILDGILRNLGKTYYLTGDLEKAERSFNAVSHMPDGEEGVEMMMYKGLIHGDRKLLEKAMTAAEKNNYLMKRLEIAAKTGMLFNDRALLASCAEIIGSLVSEQSENVLKIMLFIQYRDVYEKLIGMYFNEGAYHEALSLMEMIKRASSFVNNLTIPSSLLDGDEKKAVSDLLSEMKDAAALSEKDAWNLNILRNKRKAYDKLKMSLFFRHGKSDEDLLRGVDLHMRDSCLYLSFYTDTTSRMIYIISGYRGEYTGAVLDMDDVSGSIDSFMEAVTSKNRVSELELLGHEIYSWIPGGVPEDAVEIIISTHWKFTYIPFSVLWDGNEHLVDGHMVKYVTDLGAKRGETGQNKDAILALGNPDLGDERLELYFAQKEAGEIKFLFPEGTDLFKGKEATETAVKDTLSKKRFSIIHLACHGRFNRTIPELSYLMLSGEGKEDGFLYVDEIKALDVSSDLVVLSACESGTGILGEGGEVQALDKAFLSGDVGHVISSLWRISDVATGVLFKYIYRNLYQGMDMDTAYWHAVIELKKRFPEPRYWGAMKFTSSMMQ